jgi:hypothetical protein
MIKSLTKHGNSMALIIEKPILDLLGAGPETQFQITTDGRSLNLMPLGEKNSETKFKEAVAFVTENYANTLKKLAE